MQGLDPNFRADVSRSISVFGPINDELVNSLAPEILRLRSASRLPITVLINSNGGSTSCADFIKQLLATPDAAGNVPRIITVAVGNAKSAAANLLALGNYAIAYPDSAIHFHGVRYGEVENVTMERASTIFSNLENANRITAGHLARAGAERLAFHYARLKSEFSPTPAEGDHKSTLPEIEKFALRLAKELSSPGKRLVQKALDRWRSLRALSDATAKFLPDFRTSDLKSQIKFLVELVKFEHKRNKKSGWTLQNGILQVTSDFTLLQEYHFEHLNSLLWNIISRYSPHFFEPAEVEILDKLFETKDPTFTSQPILDKIVLIIKPFCFFADSIWRSLQINENPLTPADAYWLGAIDEVTGSQLPCLRMIAESNMEQGKLPI